MAKDKTTYVCQACGAPHSKWQGRCSRCGAWDTLEAKTSGRGRSAATAPATTRLETISEQRVPRLASGFDELDRVLGGGLVPGGVVLLGGAPGIGKSTLALQVMAHLQHQKVPSLYQSGEESTEQIASRAGRLSAPGVAQVAVGAATDVEAICAWISSGDFRVVVVDSIQTVRHAGEQWAAGSPTQLRELTARIIEAAKSHQVSVILIGHVTKDGVLAGPKVLEHLVDTVLTFEGESRSDYRVVRAAKNRFGPAHALALFQMRSGGLAQVANPSAAFLAERPEGSAGSVVAVGVSGGRAFLVEVQALVASAAGAPRRVASGCESDRLAIMLAILERKLGFRFVDQDVFVSVAGGLDLSERALDLPIALTLASAVRGRPARRAVAAFGEVGLAGEVRAVARAPLRVDEAEKLGFETILLPQGNLPEFEDAKPNVALHGVAHLGEAIRACLTDRPATGEAARESD